MKKLMFIVFIGTFSFLTLSSKETAAFESTYQPGKSGDILIENARILTGTGAEILRGSILISSNKIKAIGETLDKPANTKVIDANGKEYVFGDSKSFLKAKLKINNPSFCFNILRKGSSGLGESYINGAFETDDLTSLIELSAKNINITHKFSGFFEFTLLQNFIKRKIFSNNKKNT